MSPSPARRRRPHELYVGPRGRPSPSLQRLAKSQGAPGTRRERVAPRPAPRGAWRSRRRSRASPLSHHRARRRAAVLRRRRRAPPLFRPLARQRGPGLLPASSRRPRAPPRPGPPPSPEFRWSAELRRQPLRGMRWSPVPLPGHARAPRCQRSPRRHAPASGAVWRRTAASSSSSRGARAAVPPRRRAAARRPPGSATPRLPGLPTGRPFYLEPPSAAPRRRPRPGRPVTVDQSRPPAPPQAPS
mmetsp:Transcript_19579/g.55645  ORF Transcript_19579/g.55645 Transcript_19579/m.55645 type:complete len:244 (-) Transcript_19579:5948-6679(-)